MGGNKIVSYRKPNDVNELVNKSYVDQKVSQVSGSVDLPDYLKKDLSGNLNLNNQKIINVKKASHNSDGVNLEQLNNSVSALSLAVDQLYILKNGSAALLGNLNLNGHKLINMSSPVNKNDSVNKLYVDQKIGESHISSCRTNVLKYITDNAGECTADYGISSVNLIDDFDDMPHKIGKKAFSFTLQKSNQNSQYRGKFDVNLFKLIRDNFSNNYTLAFEFYFKKTGFTVYSNEFLSMNITLEVLNMIIAKQATTKVSNECHYIRSIVAVTLAFSPR